MQALMTAIVTWLAVNFGLPADYHHPLVKFVPPAEIASLRNAEPQTGRPCLTPSARARRRRRARGL